MGRFHHVLDNRSFEYGSLRTDWLHSCLVAERFKLTEPRTGTLDKNSRGLTTKLANIQLGNIWHRLRLRTGVNSHLSLRAVRPAKAHENHFRVRWQRPGAARSRLSVESSRPSICLMRSVRVCANNCAPRW